MLCVYLTNTGQTRKFAKKLDMDLLELNPTNPYISVNEPFIVVLPTYVKEAIEYIDDFMGVEGNAQYCKGVAGGGNLNFAKLYCFTAKDFAKDYEVPLIHCFEFQGNSHDVEVVQDFAKKIELEEV